MQLGYTILHVPDVSAAVDFQERAFGLARRFVRQSVQYAEMETGATALAFASETLTEMNGLAIRPGSARDVAAEVEVALVTDAPEKAHVRAIAAGAAPASRSRPSPGASRWAT